MIMSFTVGPIPVYDVDGAFCWRSGLAEDFDGAARAYKPGGGGLDHCQNALRYPEADKASALNPLTILPVHGWCGVACDVRRGPDGKVIVDPKTGEPLQGYPFVQTSDDLAPGYLVATTKLVDPAYPESCSRRFVDAEHVPFLARPPELLEQGVHMGDVAAVCRRLASGTWISRACLFADVGPSGHLTEGSYALTHALSVPGGASGGIFVISWPGSALTPPWPRSLADIEAQVAPLFETWGGTARLRTVV